ncbi:MAG: sensor histidine kinase [Pseudomonas sp.]|jgi:two-component system sensor histidine kinase AlgZ|nr:sensor histidine kinase [Pseudomonas sp.]
MNKPKHDMPLSDDFFVPELCQAEALLGLVLLAELLVFVLVLAEPITTGFDWMRLALTSLFVQWIVLLSAAAVCRARSFLARLPASTAIAIISTLVLCLTVLCTAVAEHFYIVEELSREASTQRYIRHALISLIMCALLLRYFYLQGQWRRQQQAELQARLQALQARIHPHFLFNSLNSIASLIDSNPEKAEHAVLDLSDLFRASLAHPNALSTWRNELALAKQYISIEQYRLGKRLHVIWNIENVPNDLPIPHLTVQPLLENAVIYGIQPSVQGGCIEINAHYLNGAFKLQVSNPFMHNDNPSNPRGTRLALNNIEARLKVLFGATARLSIQQQLDRYTTSLSYPCSRPAAEAPHQDENLNR